MCACFFLFRAIVLRLDGVCVCIRTILHLCFIPRAVAFLTICLRLNAVVDAMVMCVAVFCRYRRCPAHAAADMHVLFAIDPIVQTDQLRYINGATGKVTNFFVLLNTSIYINIGFTFDGVNHWY